MKQLLMMVCLFAMAWGAVAESEYRDFSNTEGKKIRGKIIRVDAPKKMVVLQRDNGKKGNVPLNFFCEEDQAYIKGWMKLDGLRNASMFKISCERKALKSWTEEKLGTVGLAGTDVKEENQVVGKTSFEEIAYEVTLNNRNKVPLRGLIVDYNIYYEQEISARDKEPRQINLFGTINVDEIAAQKKVEQVTKPITIFKDETNAEFISSRVLKGSLHGIAIRLYVMDEGKKVLVRNMSMPNSIENKYRWATSSGGGPTH